MMEGERLVFMALSRPEKRLSLIFGGPFGPLIIAVDHNPERFTVDQNAARILSGKANKGEKRPGPLIFKRLTREEFKRSEA